MVYICLSTSTPPPSIIEIPFHLDVPWFSKCLCILGYRMQVYIMNIHFFFFFFFSQVIIETRDHLQAVGRGILNALWECPPTKSEVGVSGYRNTSWFKWCKSQAQIQHVRVPKVDKYHFFGGSKNWSTKKVKVGKFFWVLSFLGDPYQSIALHERIRSRYGNFALLFFGKIGELDPLHPSPMQKSKKRAQVTGRTCVNSKNDLKKKKKKKKKKKSVFASCFARCGARKWVIEQPLAGLLWVGYLGI